MEGMEWVDAVPFGRLLAVIGIGLILHPPLLRLCAGFMIAEKHPTYFMFYLKISLVLTGCALLALAVLPVMKFVSNLGVALDLSINYGVTKEEILHADEDMSSYTFYEISKLINLILFFVGAFSPIFVMDEMLDKFENAEGWSLTIHYYGLLALLYWVLTPFLPF